MKLKCLPCSFLMFLWHDNTPSVSRHRAPTAARRLASWQSHCLCPKPPPASRRNRCSPRCSLVQSANPSYHSALSAISLPDHARETPRRCLVLQGTTMECYSGTGSHFDCLSVFFWFCPVSLRLFSVRFRLIARAPVSVYLSTSLRNLYCGRK